MALVLSATGTVSAMPGAPYDINEQGQTAIELSIPRAAYDPRGSDAGPGVAGYPELVQFIAIMSAAYSESPLSMISHIHRQLGTMLGDRNTGQG